MKRTALIVLAVIFSISTTFLLVGCDDVNSTLTSDISFKTLTLNQSKYEGSVSNATYQFSFEDEIILNGNTDFVVSHDKNGKNLYPSKTVLLSIGNNTFYILETIFGKLLNSYEVTIRRRPIYDVLFNTNGGTFVSSQNVEEGLLVTQPSDNITREGYVFAGWDFDFSTPITNKLTINAKWELKNYSLTYDYDGGTLSNNKNPDEYNTESDFTLYNPTKDNYEFDGWYDGDVKITSLKGCYGDKTLVAKWKSIYILSNGTITGLTNYGKLNCSNLTIPSEIDGVKITAIGNTAFEACKNMINVAIPTSITNIGSQAFYNCSNLETVTFESGSNPKNVNGDTFKYCSKLKFNQKDGCKYLGNSREPYLVFVEALPIWQDFSYIANAFGKGTEFSAVEGIFTITNGKAYTTYGRTVNQGTKAGTQFTGGVQVGKNGSATDKCITFTVPENYKMIELYVSCATAGIYSEYYVSVNGVPTAYPCEESNITAVTFSLSAGDQVAIYGGSVFSTNVWGILLR